MAASFSSKTTSFNKIFIIVFGIAFALMALAMGFKGLKNTSDIRSRASLETKLVKGWEFNGTTTEGWKNMMSNVRAVEGNLSFYTKFNVPETGISYSTPFTIPTGIRNFQMNVRIIKPVSQDEEESLDKYDRPNPTITPTPVTIEVHFQKKSTSNIGVDDAYVDFPESTLYIKGLADGQFHTYTVPFPNTLNEYSVEKISIIFRGENAPRTQVDVNWIRITIQKSPKPTPTPTPTPCYCPGYWMECPKGSKRSDIGDIKLCPKPPETPREPCMNNRCPKGFKCSATPPGGCPTVKPINGQAGTSQCAARPECWPLGPIPTPTPTCTPKPPCVDGITDPKTGVKVYCDIKPGTVFCPTTPTPTPTSICRVTLSKYSLSEPCGSGVYRYVKYSCSDGYSSVLGGSANCMPAYEWKKYASSKCADRRNYSCITPTPVISCGEMQINCPAPPANCYYTNQTSCSCGELICEVYPTAWPSTTSEPMPTL